MTPRIFLFGYGRQGKSIAKSLKKESLRIHIITPSTECATLAKADGFVDIAVINIADDEVLETLDIGREDYLICVMDDTHLNVFLILSLRALFPDATILTISDSIHATQKLKMAGATKVIDLYSMSAHRIHNILQKPIATKLLDGVISQTDGIIFKEMMIMDGSALDGKLIDEINLHAHKVLIIGLIDMELSHKFIFITSGINHKLDAGDIIVCIGEISDLEKFENEMTKKREP